MTVEGMGINTAQSVFYRFYKAGMNGEDFKVVLKKSSDYIPTHVDTLELLRWVFVTARRAEYTTTGEKFRLEANKRERRRQLCFSV